MILTKQSPQTLILISLLVLGIASGLSHIYFTLDRLLNDALVWKRIVTGYFYVFVSSLPNSSYFLSQ